MSSIRCVDFCLETNVERFATTAGVNNIGVVKDKSGAQPVISPVHPTSNDTEQRLAVNQHPDTILLDNLVKLAAWWWNIVKVVGHTGTATRLYRDSQKTRFRG